MQSPISFDKHLLPFFTTAIADVKEMNLALRESV